LKFNEIPETIRDQEFTIREIKSGDMDPIYPLLEEKKFMDVQREMIKVCVFVNGKVMGDGVNDLPFKVRSQLGEAVMGMNMPGDDEGEPGKD
jgi:hypothetical protein